MTTISDQHIIDHRLLDCGVLGAALFTVVAAAQICTRTGFDLARHPISLLSNGDLGWIQIANFVVTGLMFVAFAVGLRRRGEGTWAPRLIGAFGIGLVMGGVFVADPALGYPVGAPEGLPAETSWHGLLHNVAPVIAFNALIIACFVVARRSWATDRRWSGCSIGSGVVLLAMLSVPTAEGVSIRMALGMLIAFAWTTAYALQDSAFETVNSRAARRSRALSVRPAPAVRLGARAVSARGSPARTRCPPGPTQAPRCRRG